MKEYEEQIKQKITRLEDKYSKSEAKNEIFKLQRDLRFDADPRENPPSNWTSNEEKHIMVLYLLLDAQASPE